MEMVVEPTQMVSDSFTNRCFQTRQDLKETYLGLSLHQRQIAVGAVAVGFIVLSIRFFYGCSRHSPDQSREAAKDATKETQTPIQTPVPMHTQTPRHTQPQPQTQPQSHLPSLPQQSPYGTYHTDEVLQKYMEFHYTPSRESYALKVRTISEAYDFPVRLCGKFKIYLPLKPHPTTTTMTTNGNDNTNKNNTNNSNNINPVAKTTSRQPLRGLDIGCATGASTFEMSKYFDGGVVGIDNSELFVKTAMAVQRNAESVRYAARMQGDLVQDRKVTLSSDVFPERCAFFLGDAMDLFETDDNDEENGDGENKEEKEPCGRSLQQKTTTTAVEATDSTLPYWRAKRGEKFDGILCLNVLDRVPNPRRLLKSFPRLLNEGGVLILTDPYSWLEELTDKANWIGGKDGIRSEDAVEAILSEDLEKVHNSDEPFLIREHIRLYQLGIAHCTVWRKKPKSGSYKRQVLQHNTSS